MSGKYLTHLDEPWDSPWNRTLPFEYWDKLTGKVSLMFLNRISYFQCPANDRDGSATGPNLTSYVGMAGVGIDAPTLPGGHPRAGVFGYERRTRPQDITDGTSTTMAVIETSATNGPWTAGGPATVRGLDPARRPYIGKARQFGGLHRGGVSVLFADGSVRSVRETVDPRIFEALATVTGGELIPPDWGDD